MKYVEKANNLFNEQHYHCSQSVFASFAEELGITEVQALKTGGCFAGGMRKGDVFGCFIDALDGTRT